MTILTFFKRIEMGGWISDYSYTIISFFQKNKKYFYLLITKIKQTSIVFIYIFQIT